MFFTKKKEQAISRLFDHVLTQGDDLFITLITLARLSGIKPEQLVSGKKDMPSNVKYIKEINDTMTKPLIPKPVEKK